MNEGNRGGLHVIRALKQISYPDVYHFAFVKLETTFQYLEMVSKRS